MAHWQRRESPWWEMNVVNCALCGQMIPRDVWVADDGLGFCNADCEHLYRTYWVPTYGSGLPGGTRGRSGKHSAT